MCGRVRLSSDYSEIKICLKFAPNSVAPNFEPDWNKPPTAPMLVAIRSVNGERVPKMMKWGLIPHWAKDDKLQYSTFNARAEEFTTKHFGMLGSAASAASLSLMASTSGKDLMQKES
jgi:putative SOS response-associated peptidase YedK